MPRLIDVSLTISQDLLTWPGDPPASVRRTSDLAKGDSANVSELRFGSHTGTHVDAPVHFIEGAAGMDEVPLEAMCGQALVADARGYAGPLGPKELEALGIPPDTERVLIKSDNSLLWRQQRPSFPDSYVCLAPEGARWLVDRGVRCVGVDFLSVEQKGAEGHPTHVTLLAAGVAIIEGLDLGDVSPGVYELVCLPLRIRGCDGSPARVMLVER